MRLKNCLGLVTITSLLLASSLSAKSGRRYGLAGCGLGSVIFEDGGLQTSAASTNYSTYTQFLGITSGTSNCHKDEEMVALLNQQDFMIANFATLAKEIAQGQGETLNGLAATLGCSQEVQGAFAFQVKSRHADIFSEPGAIAALDKLKEVVISDKNLAKSCVTAII